YVTSTHHLTYLYSFFQAEDGIRDRNVTGVQTCALPILHLDKSPNYIHTIGAKRSSGELYEINETANKKYTQLDIDYTYDKDEEPLQLFKRSDQYSLYQKNIPIIFYFSGLHTHYHIPEDTIN